MYTYTTLPLLLYLDEPNLFLTTSTKKSHSKVQLILVTMVTSIGAWLPITSMYVMKTKKINKKSMKKTNGYIKLSRYCENKTIFSEADYFVELLSVKFMIKIFIFTMITLSI